MCVCIARACVLVCAYGIEPFSGFVCVRCAFQLEEIDILISSCAFLQK